MRTVDIGMFNVINTDLSELLSPISFQEELNKEFFETTLPTRLEKYSALLKSRNEGKGFFFGDKVTHTKYVNHNVFKKIRKKYDLSSYSFLKN